MATILKTKNSVTTTVVPSSLAQGELAVNITDKKMWVGNASSTPIQIIGSGATNRAGGSNTQVQYNSSGDLAGSANMTFDGTILTSTFSGPHNGTVGATTPNTGSFTSLAYSTTLTGGTGIVNLGSGQFYKDASGNVGIGVVPNSSNLPTLQSNYALFSGNLQTNLICNSYYNSGFLYTSTAVASHYRQNGGAHQFYCAPSGTAGTAVSFTQVLNAELNKSVALQGATSSTGTGISFPATQSASSDANTLDDYEEGTWTPTVYGGGTAGTYTVNSSSSFTYTKIGRMVTVKAVIGFSAASGGTSYAVIGGLPFSYASGGGDVGSLWAQNLDIPTAGASLSIGRADGGANTTLVIFGTVDNGAVTNPQVSAITTSTAIHFSFTYQAA